MRNDQTMTEDAWKDSYDVVDIDEYRDPGRQVEFALTDGIVQTGELVIDDYFFNGEDEHPMFNVLHDGQSTPLMNVTKWRFKDLPS